MADPVPPPGFQMVPAQAAPALPPVPPGFVLQPSEPTVVERGMLWPVAKYSDGKVKFDPEAGLLGPITEAYRSVRDLLSSPQATIAPSQRTDDPVEKATNVAAVMPMAPLGGFAVF